MTDEDIAARIGQVVDRWTLRSVIGRGGMAAVYEGVDENGHQAAVKLLHDEYVGKGAIQRRFLREAFIMGVAKHGGAIEIYAQGLANGTPFFAMERVAGETLHQRWAAVGKLDPAEVVTYATGLLDVLEAYHNEGVVHRDIKPANLIVSRGGIRLIDFGVARYRDMGMKASEYTRDGATLGTPPFMPPEQAMGKIDRIDHRSDIFAVGAVMYSLLSAKFVHSGSSNDELLIAAATNHAESVIAVAPETPDSLVRVVDKALSFYPDDRYQSASEMKQALASLSLDEDAGDAKAWLQKHAPDEITKAAAVAANAIEGVEPLHTNVLEALEMMFRGLRRVFEAAQLYDLTHPEVERRITEGHKLIGDLLIEYPDDCGWQVRMATFDIDGTPVWTPKAPFEQVPYRMFINGFRHVRFMPGLEREELRQFLYLIMQPASDLPTEDDLATALWDLDLRHIEASMVTSFSVSDDVHEQTQFELELKATVAAEEAFLSTEAREQLELLALIAAAGMGGLAQARMMSRDAIAESRLKGGSFASRFREQFVDALNRDVWELRAAMVISAAVEEGRKEKDLGRLQGSMQALLPRYLLQGRDDEGFVLLERVVRAVPNEQVRATLLGWLFRPKNVERLMIRLRFDEHGWSDETRKRASILLSEAPGDAIPQVLEFFGQTPAGHRRIVMTYLMKNALGRQHQFADTALNSSPGAAIDMVQVLERVADYETPIALMKMLDHSDETVREAILSALAKRFPDVIEGILLPMISDESPNVRVRALRLARAVRSPLVRDKLAEEIHSSKFHALPFTERRLAIETLNRIDPALAEKVCVDIARKKLHLSLDPAVNTTRIMVLSFLGEFGLSKEGWDALGDATKRRPGNPQNVRDAAAAAIGRWRARAQ